MVASIQIFLAHANEDKETVLKLYKKLEREGYKPWLDVQNIIPGQNWTEEIPKAIKNSQLFIACFSQKSCGKKGYLQKELRQALRQYAEMPPGTIYLIPLKLEDCEIPSLQDTEFGVKLRDIQWLDYWRSDGFENLVKTIEYQFRGIYSPSLAPK